MDFLDQFTLYEVFLVGTGVVIASIVRIFYDSYLEKQKIIKLDNLAHAYNDSMDMCEEGVVVLSDKNKIIFSNKGASIILGLKGSKLTEEHLEHNVKVKLYGTSIRIPFLNAISKNNSIVGSELESNYWIREVSINTNKLKTISKKDLHWKIVLIRDITEKNKLQEKVKNIGSYRDLLTGLPTRYHLSNDLLKTIVSASQSQNLFALGIFSLKDYSAISCTLGFQKLDNSMREIGGALSSIISIEEKLYRFESNGFAIVFENYTSRDEIGKRLKYIILKAKEILSRENSPFKIIKGLQFIDDNKISPDVLISDTNRMQYGKKNGIKIEKSKATGKSLSRFNFTKEDFINRIKRKDFFFYYQPIFDLKDDNFIGVEVLTRLNHREYGFLDADDFLHRAIELGVGPEITSCLLDNVLSQKSFWIGQGGADFNMTINLSLSDLQSDLFVETLEAKLMHYGISPSTIIIDISEIILSENEDFEALLEEFYALSHIGVKLSIDHFAQNSINMKYISQLPLSSIKIDKSIVEGMDRNEQKTRIVAGIVSMGHKLGLRVGASHVDSLGIRSILETTGCDFAQGYYFGKAVPAFELKDIIS